MSTNHSQFGLIHYLSAVCFFLLVSVSALAHEQGYEEPWAVCENAQKVDQCSYTNGEGDLFRGTCQSFSGVLMCVRNQPIVRVEAAGNNHLDIIHSHDHDH